MQINTLALSAAPLVTRQKKNETKKETRRAADKARLTPL